MSRFSMTRCLCGLAIKHHFDAKNRKLSCFEALLLHRQAKVVKTSFKALLRKAAAR